MTQAAADPLAGAGVSGCGIYLEERCEAGSQQRCEVYDAAGDSWVDTPDDLLRRVLLYDRWYDLYSSPQGQCAERVFGADTSPDMDEATWADPAMHHHYAGRGDSAIWTGAAVHADAFRYAVTGTQADYERLERGIRVLLTKFDVTGVPGYLSR